MKYNSTIWNEGKIRGVKSVLKLYRKILHSMNNDLVYLDEELYINSSKHIAEVINGNTIFTNIKSEKDFYSKISHCHKNLELLNLLEKTLVAVKDYPEGGYLYYQILQLLYFDNFKYTNDEVMSQLNLSRTTYYRQFKKAVKCFYEHMIAILRYDNKPFNEELIFQVGEKSDSKGVK